MNPRLELSTWDGRFLGIARNEIAKWSKDPTAGVGAVLVDTTDHRFIYVGYNGFPSRIKDVHHRYELKELKLKAVVHAEVNAILNAKRTLDNYALYSTRFPCINCTPIIIQSGVKKVVTVLPKEDHLKKYATDFILAIEMYQEAGVELLIEHNGLVYTGMDMIITISRIMPDYEYPYAPLYKKEGALPNTN
jgi:dCMP deaminase